METHIDHTPACISFVQKKGNNHCTLPSRIPISRLKRWKGKLSTRLWHHLANSSFSNKIDHEATKVLYSYLPKCLPDETKTTTVFCSLVIFIKNFNPINIRRPWASITLVEEAIESKGGHFAKLKWFSIVKITILWRSLKFKRGHGPPGPLFLLPVTDNNNVL